MNKIKFYCINLKSRPDRMVESQNEFSKYNLKINWVEWVLVKKAPHIGAALSHAKIIKKNLKNDVNTICIFEDDIKLKKWFLDSFLKAIEHTPPDCHILYLWGLMLRKSKINKVNQYIHRVKWITGAYGVVYNKCCYTNILKTLNEGAKIWNFEWYKTFDDWLAKTYQHNHPCYITSSLLVWERKSYSNIEKRVKNSSLKYKFRFLFYKNGVWKILDIVGDIKDLIEWYLK